MSIPRERRGVAVLGLILSPQTYYIFPVL